MGTSHNLLWPPVHGTRHAEFVTVERMPSLITIIAVGLTSSPEGRVTSRIQRASIIGRQRGMLGFMLGASTRSPGEDGTEQHQQFVALRYTPAFLQIDRRWCRLLNPPNHAVLLLRIAVYTHYHRHPRQNQRRRRAVNSLAVVILPHRSSRLGNHGNVRGRPWK